MKQVQREGFQVSGISVRTTNSNEMNTDKSKIAGLWRDFSAVLQRAGQRPTVVYGVYSDYASDQHGEFDVTAAAACDFSHADQRKIYIPTGSYLRFSKAGPHPKTVMTLWQEIWDFFAQADTPKRAYLVDFEEYTGQESVAIFIGIKEGI
jgi:predicted transcriptional regulator YdeE